jgi:hypothetical protein
MTDVAFDRDTVDIQLVNGDLKFTSDVSRVESIRQDLVARLQTFAGEYFLDDSLNTGVPWVQEVFQQKPVSYEKTDKIVRDAILATPGIAKVDSIVFDLGSSRQLKVSFVAITDDGEQIQDNIEVG